MINTSEVSYVVEDIARLTNTFKTNTIIIQLVNGQISLEEAVSKIYLEDMERSPSVKKTRYKSQMMKLR